MKKNLAKLLILTLILALILPVSTLAAGKSVLRVGLAYKDSARSVARLVNEQNTGYRWGYFDDSLAFQELGQTEETEISVLQAVNFYLLPNGVYDENPSGKVGTIGVYHVQLPNEYPDFGSAREAAQGYENSFVAWVKGAYFVRIGAYDTEDAAVKAAAGIEGSSVQTVSSYAFTVVISRTATVLFQFDGGGAGESKALGIVPGLEEGVKPVTKLTFNGEKYYGAFRFERLGGGLFTVVNVVNIDDYVKGVIPYEMSASWPLEALKAQAVCARTYASKTRHSSYHFDICTTTDCQVYHGTGRANNVSDRAVEETAGLMAYYDGKAIDAVYSSSNGGASEDVKNVRGSNAPYLKGVVDPYEADIANIAGNYKWTQSYTSSSLGERLRGRGYNTGDVDEIILKYSDLGNVIEATVVDVNGKKNTFAAQRLRGTFNINSIRFKLTTQGGVIPAVEVGYYIAGADHPAESLDGLWVIGGDGNTVKLDADAYVITDKGTEKLTPTEGKPETAGGEKTFTFTGTGWGHSLGLSQWGAYAMAKRGLTYEDILHFYYTGITIE